MDGSVATLGEVAGEDGGLVGIEGHRSFQSEGRATPSYSTHA
jgi:hypothetical protein